ncbi:MAG: ribbon-helix-helix protein, CopG family [Acidobacteria bacterium]|nr:ribbon-helix-helix protein, CopG family [Acidobacteriota bacterium]MBI3655897.1 ribbon-helix-helix protein, CopG family [Acidobacteriota bacterium]
MKSVLVELPDKLAAELDALVRDGWFHSEGELVRLALLEFVRRYRFELTEQFQQEDIAWALQQKKEHTE